MNDFDNVTPIRSDPALLKPKAKELLAAATWAGNFEPSLNRNYLVKGWLDKGTLTVVFGQSNVGKSFFALDLAHHISKGETWGNRRVNKGNVLYIAAEGGSSFPNRVSALDDPEFWVIAVPVTFAGKASDAVSMVEMVQHLASQTGRFDLIVVDTLSRVMGDGDENTAPDIADLVRNLDVLRRGTGSNIMLIHHSGKDVARGARGHSSLRAAVDTEIELTRDDIGVITAEVTKQRDGPTGYKFSYSLQQIELGCDQDGDPVTTCLVEPISAGETDGAQVNGPALAALNALEVLLDERGEILRDPRYPGTPCVNHKEWMEACIAGGQLSSSEKRETHRRIFNREVENLKKRGLVSIRDNRVWRLNPVD
ncbi:AAA family ATPase [Antarcticimicrobium sediminis]|uniref:AAA family ATPase n=1 Tax=Antarcticimicrobium sediminis TaxID=2546227 RepID=A0A4R5ENW6_9RHOB|nr:AAA family ATPase [Antarcticimicrobium sediminis]TDE36318.1 AAA family ATPase [Antarcticimicrobium sediminis]